jgi:hypothetical protein
MGQQVGDPAVGVMKHDEVKIASAPRNLSGKKWFTIFRLYGPKKALFQKTWQLTDIEHVAQ